MYLTVIRKSTTHRDYIVLFTLCLHESAKILRYIYIYIYIKSYLVTYIIQFWIKFNVTYLQNVIMSVSLFREYLNVEDCTLLCA
jgi:hypothetical protein